MLFHELEDPNQSQRILPFQKTKSPPRAGKSLLTEGKPGKRFKKLVVPDVTMEPWRRTDLRAMPVEIFRLPHDSFEPGLPTVPEDLLKPLVTDQHGGQIVLRPGGSTIELDPTLEKQGVIFTDLVTAEARYPDPVARIMGQTVNVEEGKFAALAGAFAQNGVLLYVPKNIKVDQPLHSILWGPGEGIAHISHLLILVDEGASVTYVHEFGLT